MANPLVEFYRCPEGLVEFGQVGEMSERPGYFRFGTELLCYGRTSMATAERPASAEYDDVAKGGSRSASVVGLPFDLLEIVDNLHRERYAKNGYAKEHGILSSRAVQRAYYAVRPWLGVPVRKHLQRAFLRNWERLQFPRWPVDSTVEELLERVLWLCMKARNIERMPFVWFWPERASGCAMVTHDVETKAGLALVPEVIEIDNAFGIKSSFQLIPSGDYTVSPELVESIRARGCEVGIQDLSHDGNLFDDHDRFRVRATKINSLAREYGASGFRSGRLYRNADWYGELNVAYDMSVPNVGHLEAQRGGCCTVFPYFIGNVLELPVTTSQDYSVFHILGDYSIEHWKKQVTLILEKHGLASFIVHPDYSMKGRALEAYKKLLGHLAELRSQRRLWTALPQDVNRWWRERSQMTVTRRNGVDEIAGPGRDAARVAYASMNGDRLSYVV